MVHPGQQEADAQSPNFPMACRLLITQGKVARKAPWVKEFGVLLGADQFKVCSKGDEPFLQVLRTALRSFPASLCLVHGKVVQESFHLRVQELNQDVTVSLLEGWTVCHPSGLSHCLLLHWGLLTTGGGRKPSL